MGPGIHHSPVDHPIAVSTAVRAVCVKSFFGVFFASHNLHTRMLALVHGALLLGGGDGGIGVINPGDLGRPIKAV